MPPRSPRSTNAARSRAAVYAPAETAGIMMLCWSMPSFHSIRAGAAAAALALSAAHAASAQIVPAPPPLPEANGTTFTVFYNGRALGSEQIAVNRVADGWVISSSGRLAAPIDALARRLQIRYTADWHPISFDFDGTLRGQLQTMHTTVEGTTAKSDLTIGTETTQRTNTIDPASLLILTNSFFAGYEAVAARARTAPAGTDIPIFAEGPMTMFRGRIGAAADEQIQTVARRVAAHRATLTLTVPGGSVDAVIWWDDAGRLVRFSVPGQQIEVAREDIAAVSSRTVRISRANDEAVTIPSNGFTLAGTLSRPASSTVPRLPAVVLAEQRHLLDRVKITPEERQAKIDAQKKIHDAVLSGKGLDALPADVRRTVDNAEFQSLLASDPAKLMKAVSQPLLILQGELDTQVEPKNADLLAEMAARRKKAPPAEVVKVPGVNHLLATAATGEVDEYAALKDKQVAAPVTQALVSWLTKTLSTAR